MSKVVFVGNVPYNMGEEQLIDVFKSVGQVVGFRLVYDRETGKPKGYGFCEFSDHETALSAVRNLNNVDVGGRPLRIDLADSDPFLEGKTTTRGELLDGIESRYQGRESTQKAHDSSSFLQSLPSGTSLPPGTSAMDAISQVLASTPPSELTEVLAQMKAFVISHPEQARCLLMAHPQLAYALFQALLLNKIVDPAILQRMLAATNMGASAAPAAAQANPYVAPPVAPLPTHTTLPPSNVAPTPYAQMYQQHLPPYMQPLQQPQPQQPQQSLFGQQQAFYRETPPQSVPPPPGLGVPQPQQPSAAVQTPVQTPVPPSMEPNQRDMLMQVLALTPEQVAALPEAERAAIHNLRTQFMGVLGGQ